MKNILIINAGSSSLKYQLIDIDTKSVVAKGICERIGINDSCITYKAAGSGPVVQPATMYSHEEAVTLVLKLLTDPDIGVIKDLSSIYAVGHRVVHGGETYKGPALIDHNTLKTIESCVELAPLHVPPNLMGIRGCMAVMPGVPMVAVFDTSWGQTMEPPAYLYALPYEAYQQFSLRRYGFHGTSHQYVTHRVLSMLKGNKDNARIITCHLGNGSSVSCSRGGKCVDTSMGFTPLEGLPMGTRCGSIDPAIVPFLMEKLDLSTEKIADYMNKKSGMLGVSGVSSDFRNLWIAADEGNTRAKLALDIFCYSVKKLIGSYTAALGGVDAIVFTAGVGENDHGVRANILDGLEYLGLEVDFAKNRTAPRSEEVELSTPDSRVKVYIIPTDEEMAIARDTAALVGLGQKVPALTAK